MNMVRYAARGEKHAFIGAENASNVTVEGVAKGVRDQWKAILGAEDQVGN